MNLAQAPASLILYAYSDLFNGATLTLYSGTQPTSPETALSGNTALAAFTFATPALSAPTFSSGFMSATASFTASTVTPSANGTVSFARATLASTAWLASHAYSLGNIVSNNSNYYVCILAGTSASSGGPTTTAFGITDGSVGWDYVVGTAGQGNVLGDFVVGTSPGPPNDLVIGSTSIQTSVQVTITSLKLQLPAV